MASVWTKLVLSAWIMLSPWFLGFSTIPLLTWSNFLVGLALVLLNLWAIFMPEKKEPAKQD